MIDYMEKQVGDASKQVTSYKDLHQKSSLDDVTVVGFFSSPEDPEYLLYQEAGMSATDIFNKYYCIGYVPYILVYKSTSCISQPFIFNLKIGI
jgi:hypothetical protein